MNAARASQATALARSRVRLRVWMDLRIDFGLRFSIQLAEGSTLFSASAFMQ